LRLIRRALDRDPDCAEAHVNFGLALHAIAGALGKPVWVLLPFSADRRWLRHRNDSPWYPTARLFRQPALGDRAGAVRPVEAALLAQMEP
jgi:hypothetical protein